MITNIEEFGKLNETSINPEVFWQDKYVIEIVRGNRKLFINDTLKYTWRKEYAKKFDTLDAAENEIKTNSLLKNYYTIIKYSDAKNH